LPNRLDCQDELLKGLTCTEPAIGKWFVDNSVLYVLSAFKLSDKDFASVFPQLKNVSIVQRRQIVNRFEDHIEKCPRCSRKRSYDLEFENRLEKTLHENRDYLRSKLDCGDEDKPAEEDHVINGKARFAHR
jgi:hypothetical protein